MAVQTDARTGIKYGYTAGQHGWGDDMNANLQTIAQIGTHPKLAGVSTSAPPSSPTDGDIYIVGASPTGDWSTFSANDLAIYSYTSTAYDTLGWRNVAPERGWLIADSNGSGFLVFNGASWTSLVTSGGGGGVDHWKGEWANNTAYAQGDMVHLTAPSMSISGEEFICHTAHTSAEATNKPLVTQNWRMWWHLISLPDISALTVRLNQSVINNDDHVAVSDESTTGHPPRWVKIDDLKANWNATSSNAGFIKNKPTLGPQLPATSGNALKYPRVNSQATSIEYVDAPSGGGSSIYKGNWATGTTYAVGDIVSNAGNLWISLRGHTASAVDSPGNGTQTASWRAAWRNLTQVDLDTLTIQILSQNVDNADSVALFDMSARHTRKLSITELKKVIGSSGGGSNYKGAWAVGTAYALGDIVMYTTRFFICHQAHTAVQATNAPYSTATWRTYWRSLTFPDVGELSLGLTTAQLADDDRIVVSDESTAGDLSRYVTVANLLAKIAGSDDIEDKVEELVENKKDTVCLTQAEYTALSPKAANTLYFITS